MTVASTTNRASYSGDGSTTVFSAPFYFLSEAELRVSVIVDATDVETVKTLSTHYTIADEGNPAGGSVTFLTAPAVGETVLIVRETSRLQPVDFSANPRFNAASVEKELDRLAMSQQDLSARLDRTLRLPVRADAQSDIGSTSSRASKILGFDAGGDITFYNSLGVGEGTITEAELADGAIEAKLGYTPVNPSSAALTGTPTAPTASAGTSTTQIATTAFVAAATASAGQISPWEISGCEPTRYSANVFQMQPGGAANSSNDPTEMLRATSTINIDLTTNGLNGLDTGSPASMGEIYIYLIKHLTTGVVGYVASSSISYGGVVYPSGYGSGKARKLPWGIVYRSGGIPSFNYWGGKTMFTDPDVEGGFFWADGAYNVDTAGAWTTIDLKPSSGTKLLPDNSRLAKLWVRTDYVSASGRSYVRTPSTSGAGKTTGYVTSSASRCFSSDFDMQTNSTGQIQIKTDTGVKIWVSVVGYTQSEYS